MNTEQQEIRWHGLGVSEGLVVGRVLRMHNGTKYVYRMSIDEADIERELRRFRAAVQLARRQLAAIKERAETELGKDHAYIFDAHLLLLEDEKLIGDVESFIAEERVNAEWAVKVLGDRLLVVYSEIKDDYLRERGSDIEDVVQRLVVALSGGHSRKRNLSEQAIIVSRDLLPSAVAELDLEHARAIATDLGGWTSHTAIIARGLGIPAVVGLRDFYRRARTGDMVVVDSYHGEVILHPTAETLELYRNEAISQAELRRRDSTPLERGPAITTDGSQILLRANVELPSEFDGVRKYGAQGVGLYRSEFLLTRLGDMLSEDEQYKAYAEVAELSGDDGAVVRLFDLGGECARTFGEPERNPALGLRGIRFGLRHEPTIRTQVRAILRAATHGRLDIVLPMIVDVNDANRAQEIIRQEQVNLATEGVPYGEIRVGAMLEVPAAIFTANRIARAVDFFELGTNDLVQYTLAVDRGNDDVAEWFRSLHPAVLQGIAQSLAAAEEAGIRTIVCGEMASTPAYAAVLVGLGARELSMMPSSIPRVRRALSRINSEEVRQIASDCLACATADEVEEIVRERLGSRWPDVFTPDTLPPPRSRASSEL